MTIRYFDDTKIKKLKKVYQEAKDNKQETFIFDGGEFLTTYAKYVIEYLTKQKEEKI